MEPRIFKALALIALWMGVTFGLQAQTVVEYIHTDALGTPVAITNAAGTVIERSVYEPNGQLINRPLTDGPGFTGHVQDAATGLTYMQQRYYDPIIGRFLSVDPVAANSGTGANFNRYWYANNNPYKFTDPDGRIVRGIGGARDWDDPIRRRKSCPFCLKEGSESNIKKRKGIDETAQATDGRTEWAYEKKKGSFPENSNKYNLYVYDVTRVNDALLQVEATDGSMRPPRAGEIANAKLVIKNWRVLGNTESPLPGDIAAYGVPGGGTSFSGHAGIMISCPGCTDSISNMSAHDDSVYTVEGQFEDFPDVVYRRYTGD